ncbi:hypothetical protein ACIQ6Y_02560 [Streptomyces sp. NPDC096205]|uniref:hypothetical protein n=1 Tax=Streptomyces sp. NPDC096205 TaxID=3366081 RepID=UPI003829666F
MSKKVGRLAVQAGLVAAFGILGTNALGAPAAGHTSAQAVGTYGCIMMRPAR